MYPMYQDLKKVFHVYFGRLRDQGNFTLKNLRPDLLEGGCWL